MAKEFVVEAVLVVDLIVVDFAVGCSAAAAAAVVVVVAAVVVAAAESWQRPQVLV